MAIMELIKGELFRKLSDNVSIFYCDIHEVENFFKNPPKNNFVLISHNSDGNITYKPKRFNQGSSNDCDLNKIHIPNNLIRWYSQNVDVDHEKIESIPIGLENSQWFQHLKKLDKIIDVSKKNKVNRNLLYICHNIKTNPSERIKPYKIFSNQSWVTTEIGVNGQNFERYLDNLHSHKFVLCPQGNGIDTHRTWETLYVGSIPIEKRNLNNGFYIDLPICFVDDWEEINEDFLNKEYEKINNTKWNLDKLDFTFWENKIKKTLC